MSADASTAVTNNNNFNFPAYQAASPATRETVLAELYAGNDPSDVDNALFDEALNGGASFLKDLVGSSGMPDAIRERTSTYIDDTVDGLQRSPEGGGGIDADSEIMKMLSNMIMDMIKELGEEGEEQVEGGGKKSKKGGGEGGLNWLAMLAKAMGDAAGQHLANAIELADKIAKIGDATGDELKELVGGNFEPTKAANPEGDPGAGDRADQARAMTVLQAQMQAETQMFKMVFEAASTLLKTTGEGFSTMARKQ